MASASKSHMYCLLTNLNQKHSRKGIPGNIVQLSQNDTLEANRTDKIEVSTRVQFSSVQFSRSVMSNSLRPHELQHARPPCPSLNKLPP